MISDALGRVEKAEESTITTDICVVGAGPAGLLTADVLQAKGFAVALVERGTLDALSTEDAEVNRLSVGLPYSLDESRAFGLGGSTGRWRVTTPLGSGYGRIRELDPDDFEYREWIPMSGWPFGKDTLTRFYARAYEEFEVAADDMPPDEYDVRFQKGADPAVFDVLRHRPFCFVDPSVMIQRLMKRLMDSERVLLMTSSRVVELLCEDVPDSVSAALISAVDGRRFHLKARVFVLATGGIENLRILLSSTSRYPRGLGNENDLVGRYFMEHPHFRSGKTTFDGRGRNVLRELNGIRLRSSVPHQSGFSLPQDTIREHGLARSVFRFDLIQDDRDRRAQAPGAPEELAALRTLRRAVRARDVPLSDVGASLARSVRRVPWAVGYVASKASRRVRPRIRAGSNAYAIRPMAEQIPNPDSRVALAAEVDFQGVRLPELRWKLTEQDLLSISRSQALLGSVFDSTGGLRIESSTAEAGPPRDLTGGFHHMGTTRMSNSPLRGVVDADCRVHGIFNLFVAGSSVFPTCGYANPTLTIAALAIRLGEFIGRTWRAG